MVRVHSMECFDELPVLRHVIRHVCLYILHQPEKTDSRHSIFFDYQNSPFQNALSGDLHQHNYENYPDVFLTDESAVCLIQR